MLLSYQHLTSYCLNSCCAADYLYLASNEYESVLRTSYMQQIKDECLTGSSLSGTKGLQYITAIYYVLFLEAELEERDSEDADYIYEKFQYEEIRKCIERLGINYNKLIELMGLCDDKFKSIDDKLTDIGDTVSNIETTVINIDESINGSNNGGSSGDNLQDSLDNIHNIVEDFAENCCDDLSPVNRAPISIAGDDQVILPTGTITLDGSSSSDPDGDAITYLW